MSELITLTALLLISGMFMAILILGRVANRLTQERNAWIQGFVHLEEHPEEARKALQEVLSNLDQDTTIRAAIALRERFKR